MKALKVFLAVLMLGTMVFAQQQEYTKDDWQRDVTQNTQLKTDLTKQSADTKDEVKKLQDQYSAMQSEEASMNELYSLVGASKADVDAYRAKVNDVAGKIQGKTPEKADRQKELDELKSSKISALPEFFDRVQKQLPRAMEAWVMEEKKLEDEKASQNKEYSVVRGDCLWNIAKKKDIYGNPLAWPNIYKANRDQIKNPNLIFPKQSFKIPALSDEEKARYEKLKSNYKPAPKAK